jgi:hypothetical protein
MEVAGEIKIKLLMENWKLRTVAPNPGISTTSSLPPALSLLSRRTAAFQLSLPSVKGALSSLVRGLEMRGIQNPPYCGIFAYA